MKQIIVNIVYYTGDLLFGLANWVLLKSDSLQQKWNLKSPWRDVK